MTENNNYNWKYKKKHKGISTERRTSTKEIKTMNMNTKIERLVDIQRNTMCYSIKSVYGYEILQQQVCMSWSVNGVCF